MKTFLLLYITLTSLASGQKDCDTDDCGIPNLAAAMLGYDVGMSDPYSSTGDPGMRKEIFSPTDRTSEGFIRHAFIDKALEVYRCSGEFSSTSFKTYADYTKEKSTDIKWSVGASYEASVGFAGFSAEVSAKYRYSESTHDLSVKKFFEEFQGEMEQATAVCQTHVIGKSTLVEPVLTTHFKRFLMEINEVANGSDELRKDRVFTDFIKAYGTHYQVTTTLGARIVLQRIYESRSTSTAERNERSKCAEHEAEGCAGGGGSAFGFTAEAKACVKGSREKCQADINESSKLDRHGYESKKVITIGSTPASSIDSWGEQVGKAGGVVLSFTLQKITNLFKQRIFEANDITSEADEMLDPQLMTTFINERMSRYCQLLLGLPMCPEPPLGCGIIGSCEENEKCIPDATQELGYRCQSRPVPHVCNGKDSGCCTSSNPCGVDDGDCDSNSHCKPGLVCGHNNCPKKSGAYWDATDDCCAHQQSAHTYAGRIYLDGGYWGGLDGGYWGGWGSGEYCPFPHFAGKMELKIQSKQGGGDDTALNAIRLTCSNGHKITSAQSAWGSWRGVKSCSSEKLINKAVIRREDKQGRGDDTAANGIRFKCTDGVEHYPGDGYWGGFLSWRSCPPGSAVYGLQTQIEGNQGGGDDSALNDVKLFCAKLPACSGYSYQSHCCTPSSPCDLGQGDCDSASECSGSLICGTNNCKSINPLADSTADCCIKPR